MIFKRKSHPNKIPFSGILVYLDEESEGSPKGCRGHKTYLSKDVAKKALHTLKGMPISYSSNLSEHDHRSKIGIIERARICGNRIHVYGYLFKKDFSGIVSALQASSGLGMSFEAHDTYIEDMRKQVWNIQKLTFTGAAVLLAEKAAYKKTVFILEKE